MTQEEKQIALDAVQKLIEYFGSQGKTAKAFNISQSSVSEWKLRGLPADRVLDAVAKTQGFISRFEFRPDIYPE